MNLSHWADGIPRVRGWLHDGRLLANPYRYLSAQMAAQDSDAIQLRLMGEPTLCIAGGEAVAFFYDATRIQRRGAAPEPLRATLFGKGGVQGLDGDAHLHRKSMFLGLLSAPAVAALVAATRREWLAALQRWQHCEELSLYPALQSVLALAVFAWAGQPRGTAVGPPRPPPPVGQLADAARGPGAHLHARLQRRAAEAWLCREIEAVRTGRRHPPEHSALALAATHRDTRGQLLPARVAAVELINVLRPVVAVSLYLVFVAHALDAHADWAERLRQGQDRRDALHFVQEVRRHYPFFPLVAGRTRQDQRWRAADIPGGMRVVLDLYGTNHSRRDWADPDVFLPARWRAFPMQPPAAFVPQGGASVAQGHRCPGEDVTAQLMLLALEMFLQHMRYEPAPHRPPLDFARLPALPEGGLRIRQPGTRSAVAADALRA